VTAADFSHDQAGTCEPAWLGAAQWHDVAGVDVLALAGRHEVVVLSAHPDDETLGVGGLVAALAQAGADTSVVVATAGEASHPGSRSWSREALAGVRSREVERAVRVLDPRAPVHHLGLPDGGLTGRRDALLAELVDRVRPESLVVAPWVADGHPDHDVLGSAAREVGRKVGASVVHYPLWLWHWGGPADLPWRSVRVVEPGVRALGAKRRALDEFPSQTAPLGPGTEHAPVVTEPVLRRARRPFEVLLDPDGALPLHPHRTHEGAAAVFDAMFDDGPDPWRVLSSRYEERRRDLALSVLRRRHHPRVLELGCSTGVLTSRLAEVAGSVTAVDASARALQVARRIVPTGVTWVHGAVPEAVPPGPFDLVVLSELGYFLTPLELVRTLAAVRRSLAHDGEVLLVHWQHPTREIPLDGRLVHELAGSVLEDLGHVARYRDADVALDLWGGPTSLAAQEGRG
jgi:LmbE family N-acetylglucosaminyl deacetylase/SAM-dependent methyltransferase